MRVAICAECARGKGDRFNRFGDGVFLLALQVGRSSRESGSTRPNRLSPLCRRYGRLLPPARAEAPGRPLDWAAVAGERIRLEVEERDRRGSAEARRLRRRGLVPGVLYGRGKKPHAICVPERELRRALTGDHGLHAILDVVLAGQKTTHASILKEYQLDPLRDRVTHVDLQEVRLDQPIHAAVVVELVGEAPATKAG